MKTSTINSDKTDVELCDSLAVKYLHFDDIAVTLNRQEIPELQSFYYSQQGEDGCALLACKDGSFLHTNNSVPIEIHIEAFKSGLRSNQKILDKKT